MSKRSFAVLTISFTAHSSRLVERKCLYDNRLFILTRMLLVMFGLYTPVKERVQLPVQF